MKLNIITDDVTSKWKIVSSFFLGLFNSDLRMTFSSTFGSIKRMHFNIDGFLVECFSFSYSLLMKRDLPEMWKIVVIMPYINKLKSEIFAIN